MKVAVAGCVHGEVERMYTVLETIENEQNCKVDLLLCCGDFQAVRDESDLESMTRSKSYHDLGSFRKYYSEESTAPVLTIFIGGNHEASNYLQELPFGGWVAPNIYYLGYAGCVNVNGLRIGGISGNCGIHFTFLFRSLISVVLGIYKKYNYRKCHYEVPPYNEDSKRSVYHVRELDVFRLKQLSKKIDIFISHDWPRNIDKFGEVTPSQLIAMNPNFESDIENNCLGSPANKEILDYLQPSYWFAAHLHCRFSAEVPHNTGSKTKFLALDKAVNDDDVERKFIEILDIDVERKESPLSYDLEWLTILHNTQHLVTGQKKSSKIPKENGTVRWNFTPTTDEEQSTLMKFAGDLVIPINFCRKEKPAVGRAPLLNQQTVKFCSTLDVKDPLAVAMAGLSTEALSAQLAAITISKPCE